jgi:hypothetical protein
MPTLTAQSLKAFLDANPAKYKPPGHAELLPDGYLPSGAIENLLASPVGTVANPVAQAQIKRPFTAADLMGQVSPVNRVKIMQAGLIGPIQHCIDIEDTAGILSLSQLAVDGAAMTADEQTAVAAVVNATIGDPSWTATVPGPSDLFTNFGVTALPQPNLTHDQAGALIAYRTFIDQALSRPGLVAVRNAAGNTEWKVPA